MQMLNCLEILLWWEHLLHTHTEPTPQACSPRYLRCAMVHIDTFPTQKKKRSFQKRISFRPGTFAMWHRKHRLLCSYFHFSTFSPICKVTQTEKKTFFQPIGENHQNGPRPGQPDLFNVLLNLGSSHTRAALFRQMPYDKRPGREKCATVVRTVMCHGKCPFLKFSAF